MRYIANRSSGKQGFAIAVAAQAAGADVTLISGPVDLGDPAEVTVRRVGPRATCCTRSKRAAGGYRDFRRRGCRLARRQ